MYPIDVSNGHFTQAWKEWFDTEVPEDTIIPDGYSTSLSTLHKLLLIRSWCPDRTIPMAKLYVAEVMGKQVGHLDVDEHLFYSVFSFYRYSQLKPLRQNYSNQHTISHSILNNSSDQQCAFSRNLSQRY